MGSGLVVGAIIVVLFIVVAAGGAVAAAARLRHSGAPSAAVDGADPSDGDALVFRPSPGQDPAAVVLALHSADVEAVSVLEAGEALVLIPLAQGGSAEEVRSRARTAISERAALNLEGDEPGVVDDVRFTDEPPA